MQVLDFKGFYIIPVLWNKWEVWDKTRYSIALTLSYGTKAPCEDCQRGGNRVRLVNDAMDDLSSSVCSATTLCVVMAGGVSYGTKVDVDSSIVCNISWVCFAWYCKEGQPAGRQQVSSCQVVVCVTLGRYWTLRMVMFQYGTQAAGGATGIKKFWPKKSPAEAGLRGLRY